MVILGTAGHIDHGKTSVIYALTGIDADRLPEEKARGMTIDLGFAWMETSHGEKIGIIDVPGHEHFIRNMITGISSVDAFLLVVDAKEGWKPQTEEHFQIIRLLDIIYGLIVITKTDLVLPERIKEVEQEIRDRVNSLNQFSISILHFSNKDKESITRLRKQIESVSKSIPQKRDIGKPRLFIDRVFEIRGSGTVVTGALLNGNLYLNQSIYLFPSLKEIRLREIQSYNLSVEKATIGSRVALNLSGVKKEEIRRGDLIYGNQKLPFGNFLDVILNLLPQKNPIRLKNGTEVEFISHTKILRGTIIFEQKELLPEEQAYAQIRFKEPLCLMIGDYFIIRLPGINETIGGGRILDAQAGRHSFHNPLWHKWLEKREKLDISQLIVSELERHQKIKKELLLVNSPYSQEAIYQHLKELNKKDIIFLIDDWVVDFHFWNNLIHHVISFLEQKHKDYPLKSGFPIIQLRNKFTDIPEDLFLRLLDYLSKNNKIKITKGIISSIKHSINLSAQENKIVDDIVQYIEKDIGHLPVEKELKDAFKKNTELIDYLMEQGEIIKLEDQICITPSVYREMKDKIVDFLRKNKQIAIGQVRDLLHISRKYIVPILTRMDEEGITIRKGNERILRQEE
jgi:selenocysteine-specific elongation factor